MDRPALHSWFDRVPRWTWFATGVLLLLVIVAVVWDWNWFKGPIERRVSAATGREFSIDGDLDVDLGLRPRITARDIHFGNAKWSDVTEMASAQQLDFRIALWPLLRGRVELPYVALDKPRLLLEQNKARQANWIFDTERKSGGGSAIPFVGDLIVRKGELRVHEPLMQTDVRLNIRSGKSSDETRAPLLADGDGQWRGYEFKLAAKVDSPLDLRNGVDPYRVDVRATAGETRAHASGALRGQLQVENFAVLFELSGANLADLYHQLGIALPDTPPYRLSGELSRQGDTWRYRKFKGKVGDSDLSGDASIALGEGKPRLEATLVSQQLDFDDLAGFIGAPPRAAEGETLTAAQRKQAAAARERPTVLPDKSFDLTKLRSMDADVTLEAAKIEAPKLPLERMNAHMVLKDGVVRLDPLDFDTAGGSLASRVELDARQPSIQTTLVTEIRNLQLPKLLPTVEITKQGAGRLSGTAALTMQGNSIAYMLGSANGDIGLIMGPGHISNLLVELAGLDVAESLKYLIDKDREIPLRCAYADFRIVDGQMSARSLAFDTTDTVIYGEGNIDLRREAIDLRLVPQPKDKSPVSLRVPLKIGGSFKDPSFHPEGGPLLLRTAAAAALYSVAPPAALLALIETGPGKSLDCGPAADVTQPQGSKEQTTASKTQPEKD
jgi:uncharacterized protein involved in outer membrane biogenesis